MQPLCLRPFLGVTSPFAATALVPLQSCSHTYSHRLRRQTLSPTIHSLGAACSEACIRAVQIRGRGAMIKGCSDGAVRFTLRFAFRCSRRTAD